MEAKKVLFITQEIMPYVPETKISEIGRNLPQNIQEGGREIRTFMPKWGNINERRNQLHEVIRLSGMNLIIDDTDHPLIIKVASIQSARMQVYFIDNDDYFQKRQMRDDENGEEYDDNAERATFYARGVMETVKKLRWVPDIIHCHGWISALAPMFIKEAYKDEPSFRDAKVIYSIYDDIPQRPIESNLKNFIKFKGIKNSPLDTLPENCTFNDLTKLAIDFSDGIIQGSADANEGLLNYAKDKNKPILGFVEEEYFDAYSEFYDKVWSEGK